jgi:hypothetical protein
MEEMAMEPMAELKGWMVDRPEGGPIEIRAETLDVTASGVLAFRREGTTWAAFPPGTWTYVDRCWVSGERAAG